MKNKIVALCMVMSALALPLVMAGCAEEVSKTTSSKTTSDGTVKTDEKTVTKAADGTVTKTEESKTTTPPSK